MPFDFIITFRKGKNNPADGPSKRPDFRAGDGEAIPDTVKLLPLLKAKIVTNQAVASVRSTAKPETGGKADSATESESEDEVNSAVDASEELNTLRLAVGSGPGTPPDPADDDVSDSDLESTISEADGDGPDPDPLGSPGEARSLDKDISWRTLTSDY